MVITDKAPPRITPNDVYVILDDNKDMLANAKDPLVNDQLKILLEGLYDAQGQMGAKSLDRPTVQSMSTMSNAALITLLMNEIRKTNNMIAVATALQVKQQNNEIKEQNAASLEKLNSASEAAKEADDLSDGLDIFKWAMLALSILLVVVSIVATICTFGGAAKTIALSVSLLIVTVACTVATSVPVDDEQNSAMDLASQELAKAIEAGARDRLLDDYASKNGIARGDISQAKEDELIQQAIDEGTYGAMAVMLSIQIIIAIAMIAVSAGAASGAAASQVASGATGVASQTTQSAISSALQAAKAAIQANLPAITSLVKNIQFAGTITQALGNLGASGAKGAEVAYSYEAETNDAYAQKIKALVELLESNNAMLIALIEQLNKSTAESWQNVADVLKAQHKTARQIALQSNGAAFA